MPDPDEDPGRVRLALQVEGTVQGVGFRPFVHTLATELGLAGSVRNETGRVLIEIEGSPSAVRAFVHELERRPPPLARIDSVTQARRAPSNERAFRIEPSRTLRGQAVAVTPDIATCPECLREIFDPNNRRYRYAFTNCTNCGPRLTIVTGSPYDRERTTMASFEMCASCRAEYEDPADRRFHAQPIACPACGPELRILNRNGVALDAQDPLREAAQRLAAGQIGAIKGLGGYHLACVAESAAAVQTLRNRKRRDQKPFALMVRDIECAAALCEIDPGERALLVSPERPIVLVQRLPVARVAAEVAPGVSLLGLMLPYTPLHHLLLESLDGRPLVMTSGNLSDEPLAYRDDEALQRLARIADFFLTHNRPIRTRCDDSVTRVITTGRAPDLEGPTRHAVTFRRSRGYAPLAIPLPFAVVRPTLALGGQLKNTFALGRERSAVLSAHHGDLEGLEAYLAYLSAIEHFQRLYEIAPERVVHDLHPDYASTRLALELEQQGGERLAVQHHHAHMAACMSERALDGPTIGVVFDGMGLGPDGTLWGGEFLVGDAAQVVRAAHLVEVALPGGDRAAREPWRMAVSYLAASGIDASCSPLVERLDARSLRFVERMIASNLNCPLTSSAGRLFDAIAALAGVGDCSSYEGQAAMRLEALAARGVREGGLPARGYPFAIERRGDRLVVDSRPIALGTLEDVQRGIGAERVALRFHATLVAMVGDVCRRLSETFGTDQVVLSGGVFMNAVLTEGSIARLTRDGLRVYTHATIPPNDGGLSYGQLAVAAALDRTHR